MWSADGVGLMVAVFLASAVEVVEAFTIVLAMGVTRGWKAALAGTVTALVVLATLILLLGSSLGQHINPSLLQFIVGTLLLVFGLQWLRKAILRSAGYKALHDEDEIYSRVVAVASEVTAGERLGVDVFGFVVSFKGVLLEGLEVVFIVITFGLGAANRGVSDAMPVAALGALIAALVVVVVGVIVRHPLSMVPENAMKYCVGLLLSSFGVFWAVEGMGYFAESGESLRWPGELIALLAILIGWAVVSRLIVWALRHVNQDWRKDTSVESAP